MTPTPLTPLTDEELASLERRCADCDGEKLLGPHVYLFTLRRLLSEVRARRYSDSIEGNFQRTMQYVSCGDRFTKARCQHCGSYTVHPVPKPAAAAAGAAERDEKGAKT